MIKDLLSSLGLGILSFSIMLFLYNPIINSSLTIIYLLFFLSPLPILLSIFYFRFWISLIAFIPSLLLITTSFNYFMLVVIIFIAPLFIIFIFINFKVKTPGKYIPIILLLYSILVMLLINYLFSLNNISLADMIIDFSYSFNPINTNKYLKLNDLNLIYNNLQYTFITLFLPSLSSIIFCLTFLLNYILANFIFIKSSNSSLLTTNRFLIGYSLPKLYIYFFILELLVCLLFSHFIKHDFHIIYILYNVSLLMFIVFLIPGLKILQFIINKNKILSILLILVFLFSNIYLIITLIILLCLLGFLKEAKTFYLKKN